VFGLAAAARFVVMGDSRGSDEGINEAELRKLFLQIKNLNPSPRYIVFVGDLVSGSKNADKLKSQLQHFKQVFTEYFPIEMLLPAIGNHETGSSSDNSGELVFSQVFSEFSADKFLAGYNRTVYFVDYDNARLVILNPYHPGEFTEITGAQLEWLKSALSGGETKHKFVFLHSPPYPTGDHLGASLDAFPKTRDQFWSAIDQNNVDIVFAGHEHNYSRRTIDSTFSENGFKFTRAIPQIISGGAGAPPEGIYRDSRGVIVPPQTVYHFVIVDVLDNETKVLTVSDDDNIIDQFIVKKSI
jgi:hypothetical protein